VKILVITQNIPNPTEGSTIRMYNFIKYLSKYHEVYLVSFFSFHQYLQKYYTEMNHYCKEVYILKREKFLSAQPLQLVMNGIKNIIKYYSTKRSPYGEIDPLSSYYSPEMEKLVNKVISNVMPDIIITDNHTAYYAAKAPFPKVVDAVDCASKLWEDLYHSSRTLLEKTFWRLELLRERYKEIKVYNKYDKIFVVTKIDKKLLSNNITPSKIIVLPNGVDSQFLQFPNDHHEEHPSTAYLGHLGDYKNIKSVMYFYQNIYPIIKKRLPSVKFYLIGKDPSPTIKNLQKKDNSVIVTGFVDDIKPYISRASVIIVPTIHGTGIKNKMLVALAMGKATVATSIGALGIEGKEGHHFIVSDNPKEFGEHVVNLLLSPIKRKKLGIFGKEVINHKYTWEVIGKRLLYEIEKIVKSYRSEL